MKRIFAWILALLVAVSLFAGCDLSEKDVQFISDVPVSYTHLRAHET